MVDVNFEGLKDDEGNEDWFPDDVPQRHQYFTHRNYVKLRFDSCLKEIRITVEAIAINVGTCNAEPILEFLAANGINWNQRQC